MLPEVVQPGCGLPMRLKLSATLWQMILSLDAWASAEFRNARPYPIPYPGLWVVSGQRTARQNESVGGAPDSRHKRCPSEAVDLRLGSVPGVSSPAISAWLGAKWISLGGRWGGMFSDPSPNHFDTG